YHGAGENRHLSDLAGLLTVCQPLPDFGPAQQVPDRHADVLHARLSCIRAARPARGGQKRRPAARPVATGSDALSLLTCSPHDEIRPISAAAAGAITSTSSGSRMKK